MAVYLIVRNNNEIGAWCRSFLAFSAPMPSAPRHHQRLGHTLSDSGTVVLTRQQRDQKNALRKLELVSTLRWSYIISVCFSLRIWFILHN